MVDGIISRDEDCIALGFDFVVLNLNLASGSLEIFDAKNFPKGVEKNPLLKHPHDK